MKGNVRGAVEEGYGRGTRSLLVKRFRQCFIDLVMLELVFERHRGEAEDVLGKGAAGAKSNKLLILLQEKEPPRS